MPHEFVWVTANIIDKDNMQSSIHFKATSVIG